MGTPRQWFIPYYNTELKLVRWIMFEEGLVLSIDYERNPSFLTYMESCDGDEMNPSKADLVTSVDLSTDKTGS